jgi:6-phosphogluconolactonase
MKKSIFPILAVVTVMMAAACAQPAQTPDASQMREYVVVGSGGGQDEGAVTTYLLDRSTGDLTQVDRKPVGQTVSFMAINPNQPVLYATDERGGPVNWIELDPSTGMLNPVGQQTGGGNPVYLSVDATGSTLLGVNYGPGTVDAFPIDPATGALGAPVNYVTGANSHSAVFHPNNNYVYVASVGDNHIAQYSYSNGALTPLSPATVSQEGGTRHIFMHPSGDYVYGVAGPTDNVAAFRVGGNGTLTPLGTVRRLAPEHAAEPRSHMGSDLHVSPNGRFVYAANRGESNSLAIYSVGADGSLSLVGHESTQGVSPRNFAIDPDGEIVAVGNQQSRTVALFQVNQDTGELTHLHTEEVGVSPWFVGIWRVAE